ncbi:MAG: hypothetical protein HY904_26230 [Deltaproteobacteria bacterium]|nr:hypothetical protein [Deltaproteobacteria bacterium]
MALLLAVLLAQSGQLPSVAVLELAARQGVGADVATLLTDHLAIAVRRSGRFRTVTAMAEIVATLAVEQQKMMADCDRDSCLPEIGGALGVDLLIFGNVGRVGRLWVVTLRMVDARTAGSRGSASRTAQGDDPSVLFNAIDLALADMLAPEAGSAPRAPPPPDDLEQAGDDDDDARDHARRAPPPTRPIGLRRAAWLAPAGVAVGTAIASVGLFAFCVGVNSLGFFVPAPFSATTSLTGAAGCLGGLAATLLCVPGAAANGLVTVLTAVFGRGRYEALDHVLVIAGTIAAGAVLLLSGPLVVLGFGVSAVPIGNAVSEGRRQTTVMETGVFAAALGLVTFGLFLGAWGGAGLAGGAVAPLIGSSLVVGTVESLLGEPAE